MAKKQTPVKKKVPVKKKTLAKKQTPVKKVIQTVEDNELQLGIFKRIVEVIKTKSHTLTFGILPGGEDRYWWRIDSSNRNKLAGPHEKAGKLRGFKTMKAAKKNYNSVKKAFATLPVKMIVIAMLCSCLYAQAQTTVPATVTIPQSELNKLIGPPGPAGKNGNDGAPGATGPQGPKGDPGTGLPVSLNYGFVRNVVSFEEYIKAFKDADLGLVRTIHIGADFAFKDSVPIPVNSSSQLIVYGNGAILRDTIGLNRMHYRQINTLADAKKKIGFQLIIYNTEFKGKAVNRVYGYTGMAFDMSSSYQTHYRDCIFTNFRIALNNEFCLQGSVEDCQFDNNKIAINIDWDRFSNNSGSNTESQSNHFKIADNKFRSHIGDSCNIRSNGASGVLLWHNIHEGGDTLSQGANYAVCWDDNGSAVVKEFNALYEHIEFVPMVAMYLIKLKDGQAAVGGQYIQKKGTIIKFTTSAYAKIVVKDMPFLNGEAKFQSTGSARWTFSGFPASFDANNPINWIGAVPSQTIQYGYDPNGQAPYIKINGKKVTTAP